MFADSTNSVCENRNIQTLCSTVNKELTNFLKKFTNGFYQTMVYIKHFFLNVKRTKYNIFHKQSKTNNIPLLLPK